MNESLITTFPFHLKQLFIEFLYKVYNLLKPEL